MAFRSATTAGLTSSSTSITVNAPAGIAAGDVIVLAVCNGGALGQTITWPAGFTERQTAFTASPSQKSAGVATKTATGSEPSTYTISFSGSDFSVAICLAYSAATESGIVSTTSGTVSATAGPPIPIIAPSLTPQAVGANVIWIGGAADNIGNTSTQSTPPSGMTVRAFATSTPAWTTLTAADLSAASTAATGALSGSSNGATNAGQYWAFGISLAPVAVPTITTQPVSLSVIVGRTATFSVLAV